MDFYDGAQLDLLINGQSPECLANLSLTEVLELAQSQNADEGWRRFRPNNQSFQISLSGDDQGAYSFMRGLKRSMAPVTWVLSTTDAVINQSGTGYVSEVSRTSDANNDETFTATIIGYAAIV